MVVSLAKQVLIPLFGRIELEKSYRALVEALGNPLEPQQCSYSKVSQRALHTLLFCNDVVRGGSMRLNYPKRVQKHPADLASPLHM